MQELNHWRPRRAVLPALIALLCIALQSAGLSDTLRFDRGTIDAGQWWLLLSCNFVHLGMHHLLLNLAGLGLVYLLLWSHYSDKHWVAITLLSSLTVGLGLYLWNPELRWYVGFSGTLHGLLIAGAIADTRRFPISGGILLALVVAKLIWEQIYGAMPGSEDIAGGRVIVDSHLYGALCGCVYGLTHALLKRSSASNARAD